MKNIPSFTLEELEQINLLVKSPIAILGLVFSEASNVGLMIGLKGKLNEMIRLAQIRKGIIIVNEGEE